MGTYLDYAARRAMKRDLDGFTCNVCGLDCLDGSGVCETCMEAQDLADDFAACHCREDAVEREIAEALDRAAGIGEG